MARVEHIRVRRCGLGCPHYAGAPGRVEKAPAAKQEYCSELEEYITGKRDSSGFPPWCPLEKEADDE